MRDFDEWLSKFRASISSYDYYIDFEKVVKNVEEIKVELNILNSLIGSKNIEEEFEAIVKKYPETLKCIPLLICSHKCPALICPPGYWKLYRNVLKASARSCFSASSVALLEGQ